jgi:hypothetical protein
LTKSSRVPPPFWTPIQKFGWPVRGIAQRLRKHPALVRQLTTFHQTVEMILQSRIQVLAVSPSWILTASTISRQTGLLSNDALIVAVMQNHGLTDLASNDADFDRVPKGLDQLDPVDNRQTTRLGEHRIVVGHDNTSIARAGAVMGA